MSVSTTVTQAIDKFIPNPPLSIADVLKKELESHHLTPVDLLEYLRTRVHKKVSFTNKTCKMQHLVKIVNC